MPNIRHRPLLTFAALVEVRPSPMLPAGIPTLTANDSSSPAGVSLDTLAPAQPSGLRRVAVPGTTMNYTCTVEIPFDWQEYRHSA